MRHADLMQAMLKRLNLYIHPIYYFKLESLLCPKSKFKINVKFYSTKEMSFSLYFMYYGDNPKQTNIIRLFQ